MVCPDKQDPWANPQAAEHRRDGTNNLKNCGDMGKLAARMYLGSSPDEPQTKPAF